MNGDERSRVETSVLPNGLTIATHAMPQVESVAAGLWVRAGSRSERPREHGISHLLEHMAFKGTKRRNARDIAEAIEAVGGEINAETGVESTAYVVRLLKDDLPLGLDVLGDILLHSVFDREELKREQHVVLQEIGAIDDTPEERVFDLFQETAYPGQPIGRTILGTPRSVKSQRPDDLRRFQGEHYRGPGLVLAAAGAVEHGRVVELAERHFSDLAGEAGTAAAPAAYGGGERRETRDLKEAQIVLGFEAPSTASDNLYCAQMLAAVLGGGMASRLFQEAREARGLCYSIEAFHWPFRDTGLLGIHSATAEGDIGPLMDVILAELAKLADFVSEAEVRRAKAQMRAGLLMALESPAARAGQMARHILTFGRPLPLSEILENIEAVRPADVARLAGTTLSSAPTLAAVGPVAPLPPAGIISERLSGRAHV